MDNIGLAWAALTAFAVNALSVEEPCCPHSCAACRALSTLHQEGMLESALVPYVAISGAEPDWWVFDADSGPDVPGYGKLGYFNWEWVTDRWCDPDTCEENK